MQEQMTKQMLVQFSSLFSLYMLYIIITLLSVIMIASYKQDIVFLAVILDNVGQFLSIQH